jgi:WD40 repeat protein
MADMKPIGIDQTTGQQREVESTDSLVDNIGAQIQLAITQVGDYSGNLCNNVQTIFPWGSPGALTAPSSFPSSAGDSCAFSPNGEFFVVGSDAGNYFFYQRTGTSFDLLLNEPSSSSAGGFIGDFSWTADGEFLAASVASAPFEIFQRAGSTFTRLPNPSTVGANPRSLAFSPNSEFLAVTNAGSPPFSLVIYQRDGTTFTALPAPATLPAGGGITGQSAVSWSPDSSLMAVAHGNAPFLTIYQREGTTFTKLPDPATLPGATSYSSGFSSDGKFLAVGSNNGFYYTVYSINGTTFTKVTGGDTGEFTDSANLAAGSGTRTRWAPDSTVLAINTSTVRVYQYNSASNKFDQLSIHGEHFDCSWADRFNPALLRHRRH